MARKFRPQITLMTAESQRDYANGYGKGSPYITIQYPTYRELKKNIKKHLEDSTELPIWVSRSKRGEWGEWFENWSIINGKPEIIKQGWQ